VKRARIMELRRLLVGRALVGIESLSAHRRAEIFDAVAVTLGGDEAKAAEVAAFAIREAERRQLHFFETMAPAQTEQPGRDGQ
jgi:hypothetical protein